MATPELDHPAPASGQLNAAIADAVVRVHSRCVGRGPTKARAFSRDNLVVVVMQDSLTTGERSLVDHGRHDAAVAIRRQFQHAMRLELIETVEGLTGRGVVAFLTDSQVIPDVTAQMFVLDRPLDNAG